MTVYLNLPVVPAACEFCGHLHNVSACPRCGLKVASARTATVAFGETIPTPAPVTATVKAVHTCGGPVFGRLTAGCPRCEELKGGAAPVSWAGMDKASRQHRARLDAQRSEEIRRHDCTRSRCGSVCTAFDW